MGEVNMYIDIMRPRYNITVNSGLLLNTFHVLRCLWCYGREPVALYFDFYLYVFRISVVVVAVSLAKRAITVCSFGIKTSFKAPLERTYIQQPPSTYSKILD